MVNVIVSNMSRGPNVESRTIVSHLHEHGKRYLSASNDVDLQIRLVSEQQRPRSRIYRFELKMRDQVRALRVKVPLRRNEVESEVDSFGNLNHWPRRFPPADPETKFELEGKALATIHDYFECLDDPRFGTVRLLDSLPEIRANVIEEVNSPSLRRLFVRENRIQTLLTSANSDAVFSNAGAWLRAYHSLPKQAPERHTRRSEFIELIREFAEYLMSRCPDISFFKNVSAIATDAALEVLPDNLPVGLAHGDYAMRNVLVGPFGRVTVLDTLARWRTAIFEDIAYFLTNLKMTWPQVISQGLIYRPHLIERYEHRFLNAYFYHTPVPWPAIRLFEVQTLLERWSVGVARFEHLGLRSHSAVSRLHQALENRYFKRSLTALLKPLAERKCG